MCDSQVITVLIINPTTSVVLSPIICESYNFRVGTHTYTTSNTYYDTLTNRFGCDSFIQTNLTVNPKTYGTQNVNICLGQTLSVGTHAYNRAGTYQDTFVNVYGCDSVLTTNLTVYRPTILVIDTTICTGNTYNGVVYTVTAHLADTVVSSFGCDSFITLTNIFIKPDPALAVSSDRTICAGETTSLLATGGDGVYVWTPAIDISCTSCANPMVYPSANAVYTVSTHNCNGAVLSANIFVNVQALPTITVLNMDTCVYPGQQVELNAIYDTTTTNQVHWEVSGITLCSNCPVQILSPYLNGYYYAVVSDTMGCISKDSFDVCINTDCPDTSLEIPNFVTPNGDGFNDKFSIHNPDNLPITFLRVFDRWGALIYESYSSAPEWDATVGGALVLPGVYVYYIEAHCALGGSIIKSGNLTVIE